MIWACKLLLLGDSLMVALGNHYTHDVNMGKVGDSIAGTIQRVQTQGAPKCRDTVIGLGSNVLFNNLDREIRHYDFLIFELGQREIYLMPVPAKGRFKAKADDFNKRLQILAAKYENVTYVPLLPSVRNNLKGDNVHLSYKANKIWKKQLDKLLKFKIRIQGE